MQSTTPDSRFPFSVGSGPVPCLPGLTRRDASGLHPLTTRVRGSPTLGFERVHLIPSRYNSRTDLPVLSPRPRSNPGHTAAQHPRSSRPRSVSPAYPSYHPMHPPHLPLARCTNRSTPPFQTASLSPTPSHSAHQFAHPSIYYSRTRPKCQ